MRTLVVFYSRSGNTRLVANRISSALDAEIEEIRDRGRRGVRGYLRSAFEASLERLTDIDAPKNDPAHFDLVIVGGPVWAGSLSSPVRTWLERNVAKLGRVAFFCTMGGRGAERVFRQMEWICGKPPDATLAIKERELRGPALDRAVEKLASQLGLPRPEIRVSAAAAAHA